jgi:ATP-dependent DNA helicase RecG
LHGRQKAGVKEKVMAQFKNGKLDILVATPVVEVGIDVANASMMVIEGAERFGLAQLHQLRGRVGRGEKKSYCLILADSTSPKVLTRLRALERGYSGFELAELDLKLRGPGEIFGLKQHGFPELKFAAWQDIALIARTKRLTEDWADRFVLAAKAPLV